METLFVFLNVQLKISLRIGNLQMRLEIGLLKREKKKQNKTKQQKNQNCIKPGLSQFLFLQQKM